MAGNPILIFNITGRQITAGAAPEILGLAFLGPFTAPTIGIARRTTFVVSDVIINCLAAASWQFQQSTDLGATWFDLALIAQAGAPAESSKDVSWNVGLKIQTVAAPSLFRVLVTTPGGSAEVALTLRSYFEI